MYPVSKSKIMACLQCPKRLWLELNRPDLCEVSESTEMAFSVGNQVGEIARQIYDPTQVGTLVDIGLAGVNAAVAKTTSLLEFENPIFEAGFSANGARAFADVLLPVKVSGELGWRMIEVKSSTSVKDYHRADVAVQAYVARSSGIRLTQIALATIDSTWTYPGEGNYSGLLVETDMTEEAFGRSKEVEGWIAMAQGIAASEQEPQIKVGDQCKKPFACGFIDYCNSDRVAAEFPVSWLPRIQAKALSEFVKNDDVTDMRHVPDQLLNARQMRVKTHTLADTVYFDAAGAGLALSEHSFPSYFMDFETINPAVPIWAQTRPYEQITFQFSVHKLSEAGELSHTDFLDISGTDPRLGFVVALVGAVGTNGPVYVYNKGFEGSCLRSLAKQYPLYATTLLAIVDRFVDLLPVAREHFYHPAQQGSWSIKDVLPAIAPDLDYQNLVGVRDGQAAQSAFLEALDKNTPHARKLAIGSQLLDYCRLDTYAMVRLWQHFAGRTDLAL